MLHVSEIWPLARPYLQRLQCNDIAMIRQICNVKPDDVATVRSKKLSAQLEIDYVVVNLREKRLSIAGLYTLNDSVAQLSSLQHADTRRAWSREAQDNMDDTKR